MGIRWSELLVYSILKDAKIIAGVSGLSREVKSISVYDCEKTEDFIPDRIGTMYISLLRQFAGDETQLFEWIVELNTNGVSGICIIEDSESFLTPKIIKYCNEESFPIVSVDEDLPYAQMIENITILLYFNNIHLEHERCLRHILMDKLSQNEMIKELNKINSHLKEYIMIVVISGNVKSKIDVMRLNNLYVDKLENSYIKYEDKHVIILSDDNKNYLENIKNEAVHLFSQMIQDITIGYSQPTRIRDFDTALERAFSAIDIAILTKEPIVKYDMLSDISLMILLKDSKELREFHREFMEKITEYDSMNRMELKACLRVFVENNGDYKSVAELLFQHESTIRYRINKIRTLLHMEDDIVNFHETISMFVAADNMLNN